MNKNIIEIYQNWDRDKDYLDLDLKTLKKLTNLDKIVTDEILNKINSVAFFLQSNNYEKPQVQYLVDLKNIVNSFVMIDKYFQSQKSFHIALSENYPIPTKDNPIVWKNLNNNTINELNNQARNEQRAFYSMIREICRYGELKSYKDKKINTELQKLKQLPNVCMCTTTKSDSEILRFFEMKYYVEQNNKILKIGMQDLYNFFDTKFSEYEPVLFCNEIIEVIFKEKSKQERYYTESKKTQEKIVCDGKEIYQISNMKK